jgi:hypothetical protein
LKSVFVSLIAFSVLASCATYRLQPLSQPVEKDGLVIEASALWAPQIQFDLRVLNKSNQTVFLDSKQFRLYVGTPKSWNEIPLLSGDEYYRRAEQRELSRPVVSITATEAPVYRRTTTTTIGGGGGSVTIIRTERPVVQETRTVTIVPDGQSRLDWLKERLFYTATIEPGKEYQGLVFGDIGKGTHYKLVVPVGEKSYELVFERIKEDGPFKNLN